MPPGGAFPLGTDLLGRDLLSRILYGARTSLIIGVAANGMALIIGTLIGLTAGYFRGWIGAVLMRFTDLMMAFPALLLAICLAAIFQPSLWIVAMVIALVNWVQTARVIYTETTSLAERDFIAAERTLGAGTGRILFRHILPHLVPTIIVWGTLGISTTVLLEATLSYLGVGVQPPTPSWGNIIFENQTYFQTAPWLVFFPGAAILSAGARLQPRRRRLARRARPDAAGARLMAAYLIRRLCPVRADPARRVVHHLLPALRAARRSGAPDRRALRHAADRREHPRTAWPRSALHRAVRALSGRAGAGRPRPQLPAKDRGRHADCLAPAGLAVC